VQVMQVINMRKPKFITWEEVDGFLINRMVHDSKAAAKDKETVRISYIIVSCHTTHSGAAAQTIFQAASCSVRIVKLLISPAVQVLQSN